MDVVLRADSLTAIMLGMVTFISTLVVIYASGYMHGDPGYWRFFAYVALFVFSMTMLVSVSNFVLLYVFWEAVGLCSYLLIGFWFEKPAAAAAGMKAFLVNRIGDFGFALGVFLLWTTFGTLDFHDSKIETIPAADGHAARPSCTSIRTRSRTPSSRHGGARHLRALAADAGTSLRRGGVITAICLLLFVGACGKSAQFPLHVWLPDAMEGPTPVSALIHAATMVTAGVYLVARCTPLYAAAPTPRKWLPRSAASRPCFAALIALTQTDLKRILAYSTVSQLGYMFLALGTGSQLGVTSGMFHLFTHAFFKALLFLGAGSVMHAMGGVIDIRQFGGLRRKMPVTHWTFLFGCLALSGIFPFAGFWSKDAILAAVAEKASEAQSSLYEYLYCAGTITAFLTASYASRLFPHVPWRGADSEGGWASRHQVACGHDRPAGHFGDQSTGGGGLFPMDGRFPAPRWIPHANTSTDISLQTGRGGGTCRNGPGVGAVEHLEIVKMAGGGRAPHRGPGQLGGGFGRCWPGLVVLYRPAGSGHCGGEAGQVAFYVLSYRKFFIDEIYAALIVRPLEALSALLALVDQLLDRRRGECLRGLAAGRWVAMFRPLQGGLVQFYALVMALRRAGAGSGQRCCGKPMKNPACS